MLHRVPSECLSACLHRSYYSQDGDMEECPFCGEKFISQLAEMPLPMRLSASFEHLRYICSKCFGDITKAEHSTRKEKINKDGHASSLIEDARTIICTSSHEVAQREIAYEIEVITAEYVFGMDIFKDFLFARVRDVFGDQSDAIRKVLRDARKTVLAELRREALMVGADAVICLDLDYQEFSGDWKGSMLMVVASGTAVKLKI